MMDNASEFELDKRRVRTAFARAAASYDAAAVLQREIGDRLLARLDLVKIKPARVLDLGAGTGYCTRALRARYPRAQILALDLARASLVYARTHTSLWTRWRNRVTYINADAERLPLKAASVDLIVSNLTLQWCNPDRSFRACMQALRPGGLLMFTSFGPDTLIELRRAWRAVDEAVHVHPFIDMHDIGDALVRAGFADPVMDTERVTVNYPEVSAVLHDLKAIGAHNAARAQRHALTGKDRFKRFVAAYEAMRREGKIPATYEVVYGHAWAPERQRGSHMQPDGSIAVPLTAVKRR